MKNATAIASCYIGPELSPEQFIPEHFFLYLTAGAMTVYDSHKEYGLKPGDYGLARRNHLAKYNKQYVDRQFEKVVVVFDQAFLKAFHEKYAFAVETIKSSDAIIPLGKNSMVDNFIQSLTAYLDEKGDVDADFSDLKRSELLLILLRKNPELASVFFDFTTPEK